LASDDEVLNAQERIGFGLRQRFQNGSNVSGAGWGNLEELQLLASVASCNISGTVISTVTGVPSSLPFGNRHEDSIHITLLHNGNHFTFRHDGQDYPVPGDGDCLYTAFIGAVRAAGGNCDVITPMLNGGRDARRALEVPGTDLSVETEFADGGIFHIRQQGRLHREHAYV